MKLITNKDFLGGDVMVEDKHFRHCTFVSCSLVWNGAPCKFDDCTFNSVKIMTNNPVIRGAWNFMHAFQQIANTRKVN